MLLKLKRVFRQISNVAAPQQLTRSSEDYCFSPRPRVRTAINDIFRQFGDTTSFSYPILPLQHQSPKAFISCGQQCKLPFQNFRHSCVHQDPAAVFAVLVHGSVGDIAHELLRLSLEMKIDADGPEKKQWVRAGSDYSEVDVADRHWDPLRIPPDFGLAIFGTQKQRLS